MRRRLPNGPAWADALVSRYRKQLGVPEGKAALPVSYDADFLRTWGRRDAYMSLGTGFYGVVYPTRRPGVVLKITRDASEAYFTKAAMTMDGAPPGMVRFYDIRELPKKGVPPPNGAWGDLSTKRGVYAIWREEVPSVGASEPQIGQQAIADLSDEEIKKLSAAWYGVSDYMTTLFELYVAAAHLVRQNLLKGRHGQSDREAVYKAKPPTKQAKAFLDRVIKKPKDVPLAPGSLSYKEPRKAKGQRAANGVALWILGAWVAAELVRFAGYQAQRARYEREKAAAAAAEPVNQLVKLVDAQKDPVKAGALALAVAREAAQALADSPVDTAGEALLFYMDRGIILADVHSNNVGFAIRDGVARAVITDPGHAVFLTDEYDDLQIAPLVKGRGSNPGGDLKRRLLR